MSNLEEKVISVIQEQLDAEGVTADKSFVEDLGADSLDVVELVMALEEEFGIEIPDDKAQEIKTVQDAINFIKENQ